jgi:Rieske Fe-S protein
MMQRRGFVGACASFAAAGGLPEALAAAAAAPLKTYQRVRLGKPGGDALRTGDIELERSYVFNYPYVTTPCFLLNLDRPLRSGARLRTEAGQDYSWPGGVGPRKSLVAFSAICAHKMTHPSKAVSFIDYRPEPVSFRTRDESLARRRGLIFCCSEKSAYDPAAGAEVLGGPARQPLCTILLEYDEASGELYAVGSYGGEMFAKFFERFSPRLQLEFGRSDVDALARGSTEVLPVEGYSRSRMMCGV